MANSAAKKLAVANTNALKTLHLASLAVNLTFLLSYSVLHRPLSLKPYLFFSLPAFFLQYQLERAARPKYDSKHQLIRAGDDLSLPGMTEWFHDVIYVTWVCDILTILTASNKCWFLYLSIPSYATFKIYTKFFAGGRSSPAGSTPTETKSKRQEKLEKRGAQRVKYTR